MEKRSFGIAAGAVLIAAAAVLCLGFRSHEPSSPRVFASAPAPAGIQPPHGALIARLRAILRLLGVSAPDDLEAWDRYRGFERAVDGTTRRAEEAVP